MVEEAALTLARHVALVGEVCALVLIVGASLEALVGSVAAFVRRHSIGLRKAVWRRFAVWILMALEFMLAADIARTMVSPSWRDIGQLAAIAAIRTALNFFLERDIERAERPARE
jgi:uncharacterized membrane protein